MYKIVYILEWFIEDKLGINISLRILNSVSVKNLLLCTCDDSVIHSANEPAYNNLTIQRKHTAIFDYMNF